MTLSLYKNYIINLKILFQMKKFLLGAAIVATAATANAQVEVGFLSSEELGLSDKPTLASDTKLAGTANVDMIFPYGQEVSAQNPDFNGFKQIIVNDETIDLVQGIGGTANGKGDFASGPQADGCMYQFKVKKDGWLVVPSKISSNKNFYVFEGLVGNDPLPIAYTLGMDLQSGDYPAIPEIVYSLPADADGYVDLESPEIDKYTFGGNSLAWPIRIATQDAEAASAGNGTGAIVFPVYAEAENYLVFAVGSKMNTCGFIFVDSDPAGEPPYVAVYCPEAGGETPRAEKTVVVCGTPDPNAVNGIEAANADAPIYNAQGIRVNADAKGLLIQNGKKFIRK